MAGIASIEDSHQLYFEMLMILFGLLMLAPLVFCCCIYRRKRGKQQLSRYSIYSNSAILTTT